MICRFVSEPPTFGAAPRASSAAVHAHRFAHRLPRREICPRTFARSSTPAEYGYAMTQILYQYLAGDHRRIEALLDRAAADPGAYDMESYAGFRQGLLRHIGIEEKIVLPEIARLQGGRSADMAGRLRLDHGAIV